MNDNKRLNRGIKDLWDGTLEERHINKIILKKNIDMQWDEIKEILDRLTGLEQRFDSLLELIAGYSQEKGEKIII